MPKKIKTKHDYKQLCDLIWEHNRYYYQEDNPRISDQQFDALFQLLLEVEKEHPSWVSELSPTQRIGEATSGKFAVVKHVVPMLSLANTYSDQEVLAFYERVSKALGIQDVTMSTELKIDGIAISVTYKKGVFFKAVTRGDGTKGDDVTANVKTISTLPLHLKGSYPDLLEVRGEVFMPKQVFVDLNKQKDRNNEPLFANPRNAAGGSLKLLDPKLVAARKLDVLFYGIAQSSEKEEGSHYERIQGLKKLGLPISREMKLCHTFDEVMQFAKDIEAKRNALAFEIDGIVLKVNDVKAQHKLGFTGKNLRWAIAYKFSAEQAESIIEAITVQVGRTGVLTPVAELKPVFLAGSTISRATLHNEDEVKRKDIRVKDHVIIEKGGDVIPKVVSVIKEHRPKDTHPWKMPEHCPACNTKVVKVKGQVALRCPNQLKCPAQGLQKVIHFASKQGMNIDHLGKKIIANLVEMNLVRSYADLYALEENDFYQLPNFKEKSVANLLQSLEESKKVSLAKFLHALGIPFVGKETAELIAQEGKSLQGCVNLTYDQLCQIDKVGDKVAQSFLAFFQDKENQQEVNRLLQLGVNPQPYEEKIFSSTHLFAGKTFVLTGTLVNYSREKASALIKERGGKTSSSISRQTDYLLCGDSPGSKLDKAKKLNVHVLNEQEFEKLL